MFLKDNQQNASQLIAKSYLVKDIYPKFRLYSQCKKRTIRILLNLMATQPID